MADGEEMNMEHAERMTAQDRLVYSVMGLPPPPLAGWLGFADDVGAVGNYCITIIA